MQNLFSLFIILSLAQRIRSDYDYFTEQKETAAKPLPENNFNESQSTTVITTAITVDDEKFDDYELKKLFVKNFKLYTQSEKEEYKSKLPHTMCPRRKARALANYTEGFYGMKCLSCYANGTTSQDEKCYKGVKIPAKTCLDSEYCFTEIHPLYLKRGCMIPERLNRTFVCNCPLCNDKPSSESIYYGYTRMSDWAYDNVRLAKPINSMQLPCKVCDTKGSNINLDNNCRSGNNSNYMICDLNQICYTNIDDESGDVSRGCINRVVFNSIYYFCNTSLCNNEKFINPSFRISQEIPLKGNPSYLTSALNISNFVLVSNQVSRPAINRNYVLLFVFMLVNCFKN